jgi:hypothetical protein
VRREVLLAEAPLSSARMIEPRDHHLGPESTARQGHGLRAIQRHVKNVGIRALDDNGAAP